LRVNCKVLPPSPNPAFSKEKFSWVPVLNVKLSHKHSPQTKWLECIVDSGSGICIFHADLCRALGIRKLESGIKDTLGGVIPGVSVPMYYHKVTIQIGTQRFATMAAFSKELITAGILGRRGFFENFTVKFDASESPPFLEVERIHLA